MAIQLEKTLDVEIVEQNLAELWKQSAGADDEAVLRARVANLLVFVSKGESLTEVDNMMPDLTGLHPSRVLMMLGDRDEADYDIEMLVSSICLTDKRSGAKRLCGEEVTFKAGGSFVSELPSVAIPLLVSDLPTFLWWRNAVHLSDRVFADLLQATDRLVVDSSEFTDPTRELVEINNIFEQKDYRYTGVSDINWARLTAWRALLADFYDVPVYQPWLARIDRVRVDYVAPETEPAQVAPQALLIAGWLASRLGWTLNQQPTESHGETHSVKFMDITNRQISLELRRVDRDERKPGRLVQVELRSDLEESASFVVSRSADNLHLKTEATIGADTQRGRVLPVRNRNQAQLLSREMEILGNDDLYREALAIATKLH